MISRIMSMTREYTSDKFQKLSVSRTGLINLISKISMTIEFSSLSFDKALKFYIPNYFESSKRTIF